MKKEKREVPLQTAYIQAGRCGMQPKAKHSLRAQAQLMRTETVETFELVKRETKLLREEKGERERKYDESRLVDHARFNDGISNANHNDEIINGESIPIYYFIVLKILIYDGLYRGNCCYCEHIKDGPCFNGATSAQNCK
ncbi:hypothetical protein TNCV_1960151 [Trichonephila clavipes]|nr:hypothetical protein TNCV_1960151 [Trichonephila clavipes]